MPKQPKPEMTDIDNPALSTAEIAAMRPAHEVLPALFGSKVAEQMIRRKPGRPPKTTPTLQHVSLRLDPEVVERFKATGRGWQGRINDALRTTLGL